MEIQVCSFSIVFVCLLSMAIPLVNAGVPDPMETPIIGELPRIGVGVQGQKSLSLLSFEMILFSDDVIPVTAGER